MDTGDLLLRATVPGTYVEMVFTIEGLRDDLAVCRGSWHGEVFYLKGWKHSFSGSWTLYGFRRTDDVEGIPCLEPGAEARTKRHVQACSASYRTLVELCAGMGGISLGAQAACIHTCLFVDKSKLSVEVLQANKGATVLQGDILHKSTRQQVHLLSPAFPVLISAGFPCQPFSRQGNGQALADSRSDVLKGVLRTAWLTQCAGLILECVSEVMQHPAVSKSIEELACKLGMRAQCTVLDLKDQWISRRKRWWSVVLPRGHSNLQLLPWPISDHPKSVGEVIQSWPIWDEQEELELKLTPDEDARFKDPRYGADNRRLDMAQPAPTALHSYGCALAACPCGCRSAGLSETRLLRDGLRGFAIVSARLGCLRHIHPQELGFLNGVHASFVFPKSPRAALCLIGQVASPLQALWIFLHVAKWAAIEKGLSSPPDAAQVLEVFKGHLLRQKAFTWVLPAMLSPRAIKVEDAQGAFEIRVTKPVKASDIVEAQAKLHHFDVSFQVCIDGRPVDPEAYIPAHVQKVEIRWTPVARSLALPIASSQQVLSSPASATEIEPVMSRKRVIAAVEGPQAVRDCPPCPNPCLSLPQPCRGQATFKEDISMQAAAVNTSNAARDQDAEGPQTGEKTPVSCIDYPNPCSANPNPPCRQVQEAGADGQEQVPSQSRDCFRQAAFPNPCACHPTLCSAAGSSQLGNDAPEQNKLEAGKKGGQSVRAQVIAAAQPITVHILTSRSFEPIVLPKGVTVGDLLLASGNLQIQVRHLISQEQISHAHPLTHGSLLDVREGHAVQSQAGLLGDAAIHAAIQRLVHSAPPGWFTLTPGAISGLIRACARQGIALPCNEGLRDKSSFVGAIEAGGHWACICLTSNDRGDVEATYLDGLGQELLEFARQAAQAICLYWGKDLKIIKHRQWFCQADGINCGTIAVAHAALVVGGQQAASVQALLRLQTNLESSTPVHCLHSGRGGLSAAEAAKLSALLVSKGVPPEKAEERVTDLTKKVGVSALVQALQSSKPWPNLKAAASKPGSSFRLILPDELEKKIREKALETHGAAVPQGKQKKQKSESFRKGAPHLEVDPRSLALAEGSFVTTDGSTVHQIRFEEVASDAHGLAFCSATQAAPFLQGDSLSADPLCLVTTSALPSDTKTERVFSTERFPVIYQPNGEAMLLTGSLINLGDEPVALAQGTIAEPSALATGVCKVTIFKDELPFEWEKIIQGPVKWLLNAVPAMRVCSGVDCGIDCPAFHPAIEERVDQMILDLWSRQFQTLDGKRAEPVKADVFGVLLRVPKSAVDQLQVVQHAGVYVEPRADEGAGPNEEYKVVWMPGASKDAARHIVRTAPKAISVARLGMKFGVRTKDCDEEALFALLRPNIPFVKAAASRRFRVHPLPHGTQRADLIKLLREWKWCARPLQPCRGDSQGASWLVGSDTVPGTTALPTGCGFAIATPLNQGNTKPDVGTQLYASQRTRHCIQKEQAATSKADPRGEDPWQNSLDPWAVHNANKGTSVQAKPSSGQSRIAAIEDSLLKQVNSTAQEHVATEVQAQVAQHGKATEERFARLESGLHEVQQQNIKLQEWLGSVNRQVAHATGELQEVQMGLSSQEAAINGVRHEVQQQSANTQATIQSAVCQSFQSMQATFSQQIAAQFQGQLEQFQSLLAKRKLSE